MLKEGVSVIICCYNSGWIIKRCLEALKNQNVRKGLAWEIVIVDNNCSDNTIEEAMDTMANCNIEFRVVYEKTPGLLYARKKGIAEVKYTYTIYCDDDNLLCPEYVDTMYGILSSNPNIGAAGGMGLPEFECAPDPRIVPYIYNYAVGSQIHHSEWLYGAGLALRTDIVRDIYYSQKCYLVGRKGNIVLAGDDGELVRSIRIRGLKLVAKDEITFTHVLHKKRLTWEYFVNMTDGFLLTNPVIKTMDCVLHNSPFNIIRPKLTSVIAGVILRLPFSYCLLTRLSIHRLIINYKAYKLWSDNQLMSIYNDWHNMYKKYNN